MAKFQNKYRIESNRHPYWDYSRPGRYFLTVNIENRDRILGDIIDGKMILSAAGEIVKSEIEQIPTYHPRAQLDEWVIMPDHIHLIVVLTGYDVDIPPKTRQWWHNPNHIPDQNDIKQYRKFRRQMLIPKIMGKMKMKSSKQINILNDTPGKKNWQSDYNDNIIKDQRAYINIKNYIKNNPKNWDGDNP